MSDTEILIDGSFGEGGGQVLRTSLALSAITRRPMRLVNIRAGRSKPGLQPQHLASVRAAARICSAQVQGDAIGSREIRFAPGETEPGAYRFEVGEGRASAGSTTLVFQTVLLPLALSSLREVVSGSGPPRVVERRATVATRNRTLPNAGCLAGGSSHVQLVGGTHNPWAPPFPYLSHVFLPTARLIGLDANARIHRAGWYPVGQGEFHAEVDGSSGLRPLVLEDRPPMTRLECWSATSNLPEHVRRRQAERVESRLRAAGLRVHTHQEELPSRGIGSIVFLLAEFGNVRAGFTGLGERGKPAERVADEACDALLAFLDTDAPVDPHLADQIALPLALAPGTSCYRTSEVTLHLITNLHVIGQFLPVTCELDGEEGKPGAVTIHGG